MEPTRVLRELTGSSDGMMPESERHCVGQTIPVEPGVHAGRAKEGRPSLASLPRKEERQVRLITVPGGAGKRARDLEQGAGGAGSPEAGRVGQVGGDVGGESKDPQLWGCGEAERRLSDSRGSPGRAASRHSSAPRLSGLSPPPLVPPLPLPRKAVRGASAAFTFPSPCPLLAPRAA